VVGFEAKWPSFAALKISKKPLIEQHYYEKPL
jgi:hypothetical protein